MVNYESLGDLMDGRRWWVADFRGIGRSQVLFHNAADRNWWIGTFDGGAQAFIWAMAGNSSGFGDLAEGRFFVGRFTQSSRDELLFYSPTDQNWWLATFDDARGRLVWRSAGNTKDFGNLLAGHMFWTGRFLRGNRDAVLFYYPGDRNWFVGSWDAPASRLKWEPAGNTSGFGDLLAGHKFWTGRFSRGDRDQVLLYYPGDQNWFVGSWDTASAELKWTEAGNTSDFGNLLAGHKFWIGRFSRSDRSQVLFYYPGDQNWFLGSWDLGELKWTDAGNTSGFGNLLGGHKFWSGGFSRTDRDEVLFYFPDDRNWWSVPLGEDPRSVRGGGSPDLGDARAALTGTFSRSDRAELLVQDPDRQRWWLASIDDDWRTFRWRMAANTFQPRSGRASTALRARIREAFGRAVPGCVFYVTRNGRPFADGSFGHARGPEAPDGELAMTTSTLVHVASVTKFFCAVAILRLIERWNRAVTQPVHTPEPFFEQTVHTFGQPITLDDPPVLDLLRIRPFLEPGMTPGKNVDGITLRQLLNHTSGLPRRGEEISTEKFAEAAGVPIEKLFFEPGDDGAAHIDLKKYVTTLLKQDADHPDVYNNDAYIVLTAVIEATTGGRYADWMADHLFRDPRFHDLAPRVVDPVRSARYYWFDGSSFRNSRHHPDYTDFSLAGGYYVSAVALADWVEALMRKEPLTKGRPLLEDPSRLLKGDLGSPIYLLERFTGIEKNGGASPGDGHTNARVAFLEGYGDERIFAFVEANGSVDANKVLDAGLAAIAEPLSRRPGLNPATAGPRGLRQTAFWDDGGTVRSESAVIPVDIGPIAVGGVTVDRTLLLGSGLLAGGKATDEVVTAEARGSLLSAGPGNYVFRLSSDDGAFLWLQDELIADNGGDHGMRSCESDAVWLDGDAWYPIRLRWYIARGNGNATLEWRVPSATAFAAVPKERFRADA